MNPKAKAIVAAMCLASVAISWLLFNLDHRFFSGVMAMLAVTTCLIPWSTLQGMDLMNKVYMMVWDRPVRDMDIDTAPLMKNLERLRPKGRA
jgi:hypothetical protein